MKNRCLSFAIGAGALAMMAALPAWATTTTFDAGREGWSGPRGAGLTWVDPRLGTDAPALHTVFTDFGITFSNVRNPAFVGDYTQTASVTFGIDTFTQSIKLTGQQVSRDLVVELRDHSQPENGLPYTSVWYDLGTLTSATQAWTHFAVTIADTSSTALPSGWGGYGAEDPVTGAPELPSDRTFASVLAHVDQIAFTTLVPGYFYDPASFNVAVDNISISTPVPEAETSSLLAIGLLALGGGAARRRRSSSAS